MQSPLRITMYWIMAMTPYWRCSMCSTPRTLPIVEQEQILPRLRKSRDLKREAGAWGFSHLLTMNRPGKQHPSAPALFTFQWTCKTAARKDCWKSSGGESNWMFLLFQFIGVETGDTCRPPNTCNSLTHWLMPARILFLATPATYSVA